MTKLSNSRIMANTTADKEIRKAVDIQLEMLDKTDEAKSPQKVNHKKRDLATSLDLCFFAAMAKKDGAKEHLK